MDRAKLISVKNTLTGVNMEEAIIAVIDALLDEPEQPEIRPEAGELWTGDVYPDFPLFIIETPKGLVKIGKYDTNIGQSIVREDMVHRRNGWKRLYPEVK